MLGWLCIVISQVVAIVQLGGRIDAGFAAKSASWLEILGYIADLALPFLLIANFAQLLNAEDGYKKQLLVNGAAMAAICGVYYLVFYRYIVGGLAAFLEDPSEALPTVKGALSVVTAYGFLDFNIFVDLFLCTLTMIFLNYNPRRVFTGKARIFFRLLALLPIAYEVGCMLAERVLDIVRNRRLWRVILNVLAMLLILSLSFTITDGDYSIITVGLVASASSLLSIMVLIFSQIRLDILKEIIRKTYAVEIISGLLVMIIAFSNVLTFTDEAFHSFWDALWYCFAVVTTIGFGDLTPVSGTGRLLSVILGVYGIVVVALITSIIVNFYGEMKKADGAESAGESDPDGGDPGR